MLQTRSDILQGQALIRGVKKLLKMDERQTKVLYKEQNRKKDKKENEKKTNRQNGKKE